MSSFDHQPIETIRLNDRDKRRIIDEIKSRKHEGKGPSRGLRVSYNSTCMTVSIVNPGGNAVKYSVIPRNLSRHGVAFFHGRFIYPDCKCNIVLPTLDGESMTMEGRIVRCDHLTGTIHEVAASFNSPVDLTMFAKMTPDEVEMHLEEYANDLANGEIEQGPLNLGHVLMVDSYKLDRVLYGTMLDRIGLSCHESANAQEALDLVDTKPIDAAIIDVCQDPEYGLQLVRQLKERPFEGPIVAISADDDEAIQAAALDAGAEAFLAKPIESGVLEEHLERLMGIQVSGASQLDPIVSSLSGDEAMRPLLRGFVNDVRETASALKQAGRAVDPEHVRLICRQLKGAGGGYGYQEVTLSAREVIETLDTAENDAERIREAVDELLDVLRRVRVV
jgi:CheY-like chemotaxis protein